MTGPNKSTCNSIWICFLLIAVSPSTFGFAPRCQPTDRPNTRCKFTIKRSVSSVSSSRISLCRTQANRIDGYDDAFSIIDDCAVSGIPNDDLYDAVRFIDKNGWKIYPTLEDKESLWDRAHGSWKLQLATGGGKFTTFKPIPIFAFAMVDEWNFGNGIGWDANTIFLSLLGPHIFTPQKRQMIITIDDMYLFGGNSVTNFLPDFIKNGMGLGKRPGNNDKSNSKNNNSSKTQRPPAFTFIGASEKALIARGGTGGIAIWTRLKNDVRPAAYHYGTVKKSNV